MITVKNEKIVAILFSSFLHGILLVTLWWMLTDWLREPESEPVHYVELVNLPKEEEPEPTNHSVLAAANHTAAHQEPVIKPALVGKADSAAANQEEKPKKVPEPKAIPKTSAKNSATKNPVKVEDNKKPAYPVHKEEQDQVAEEKPALIHAPLNLTPSLDNVAKWDHNRRMQARAKVGSADEAVDINTKHAKFGDYFARVKQRISWSWVYPAVAKNEGLSGNVDVIFSINREGSLIDVKVVRSSSVPPLDQEAVAAIQKASPFGPLPETWPHEKMTIRSTFEYVLQNAGMNFVR
ncbi:MAG: energy transducer TonB [Magnetococcales bacterium]|nr:energy transducer TonB [Magnetococcales bacterium]